MKRSLRYGWLVVGLCVGLFVVGCATYYQVKDPQSGSSYYTQEIESIRGGAVKMKDARTGSIVTLQNSEIKEISEKEYKDGIAAPVSQPTPAPATAVAPSSAPAPAEAPAPAPTAEPTSAPSGTK